MKTKKQSEKGCTGKVMKKIFIMSMLVFVGLDMDVSAKQSSNIGNICNKDNTEYGNELKSLQPTFLTNVTESSTLGSNWFLEVKGGMSAFIGSPIGCGDVFDRTKPVLQVGVGKWFSPSVGARVGFQGLQFKNANLETMNYQYYHADIMYNLTHGLQQDEHGISKLDVIPFVGLGIARNGSTVPGYLTSDGKSIGNHPFALGYGVEVRYHLHDRLHLVAEISGMTTQQTFDCVGSSCKFGDNMLSLSVGLSYTIGRKGWKKVVDAVPYIRQNDLLMSRCRMKCEGAKNERNNYSGKGKNDYNGLNSLRYRLSLDDSKSLGQTDTTNVIGVGVPVYFYFKLNSAKLVDKSQLSNLDEIAKIAKEQDLTIHISGAADSATGTSGINRQLGKERAKYIGKQLLKRGISKVNLKAVSLGGINQFSPKEANRFTLVLLTK